MRTARPMKRRLSAAAFVMIFFGVMLGSFLIFVAIFQVLTPKQADPPSSVLKSLNNTVSYRTKLTPGQKAEVLRILRMTDELDRIMRRKGNPKEFVEKLKAIQYQSVSVEARLPKNDSVRDFFVNSINGYVEAAQLLISRRFSISSEEVNVEVMAANFRKVFAKKIIQGNLNESDKKVLQACTVGQ
jgi:hypothetical protein